MIGVFGFSTRQDLAAQFRGFGGQGRQTTISLQNAWRLLGCTNKGQRAGREGWLPVPAEWAGRPPADDYSQLAFNSSHQTVSECQT